VSHALGSGIPPPCVVWVGRGWPRAGHAVIVTAGAACDQATARPQCRRHHPNSTRSQHAHPTPTPPHAQTELRPTRHIRTLPHAHRHARRHSLQRLRHSSPPLQSARAVCGATNHCAISSSENSCVDRVLPRARAPAQNSSQLRAPLPSASIWLKRCAPSEDETVSPKYLERTPTFAARPALHYSPVSSPLPSASRRLKSWCNSL